MLFLFSIFDSSLFYISRQFRIFFVPFRTWPVETVSLTEMAIGSNGCAAWDPDYPTAYGYRPSLSAGVVYSVLFGLSMIVHIIQACWTRTWWTLILAVGALSMF